jgi:hypothetical protein
MKAFVIVLCTSCLLLVSCSITNLGSNVPPDGYLAVDSDNVAFIQFTEKQNQIAGHMEIVEETKDVPPQTQSSDYAFTGIQNGSAITITFSALWTSKSILGTMNGNTLTLGLPQSDGHLASETFNGASTQQYNQAVTTLQRRTSQQDEQYKERQAVSDGNDYLRNALKTLEDDSNTLASFSETSTLSEYAKDWQQMQNDYATEKNDASKGCGDNNYNHNTVQYDDNTVGYDYNSITYDDNSLSYDKNTYDTNLSAVQSDVQDVNTDWTKLQNAAKANTSGTPEPAYAQSDIDTALANAQNAETTASNTWQSAKASADTYDSEASALKSKADAIPTGMHCS